MKLPRRQFLYLAAGAAALPYVPRIARAQAYPSRPVRIILPFAAGGGADIVARILGQWLSERLGQSFVIENRPGGGGNIGTEAVVRANADGYMLLLASVANAINATLYEKLNFDFGRDIASVAGIMRVPNVLAVNPSMPATTVPEFLAYATANPGKISYASGGIGNSAHLAGELLKLMTGINMVHIPYRGGGPALIDLVGGQVQASFPTMPATVEYIKAGTLRALAVTTAMRSDVLPEVPTMAEFVAGFESSQWYGVGAPKNTPAIVVDKLNQEINAALGDAKIKMRLAELGGTVLAGTPAEFGKLIADEIEKWAKVIRAANIKPE